MKKCLTCGMVFLFGVAIGSCIPQGPSGDVPEFVSSGKVYDSQVKLLDQFVAAFKAKDADRCAELYADDAIYMVPSESVQVGNQAIRNGYVDTFKAMAGTDVKELSEPVGQVLSMGEWAVVRGSGQSTMSSVDGDTTTTYNWMILSRKGSDGSWKMVWDMFKYGH